ncbi:MAG: glutamine-hydrolyzing carbamoyl-phosphate synthase small subunit [Microgenomates group bacterium]|jgi:carbamoyl-phosphate synthase small subunit|nr:glutamine-hydrolyzing carbamoyl-phosphate synthase small subunit [Candidatus Woesebacteria bacterium]MBP6882894.1 glutamine-hydrolyzing carbamoyl-phosphate synthase small subunit [Candidatus Woesebacteria bacterium]QQR63526.1 MAG: glutamine-hydrolyzing carbamoyl-phosphate synthase small subunit [Candidatus Roizmanbacteria bacterium]
MNTKLVLEDGTSFEGNSFGHRSSISGEVVFATGMTGYPEAFTDPSFAGQILVMTYPIVGSYGVPDKKYWESNKIQISGLIVSTYNSTPSHYQSRMTLQEWLIKERIPALEVRDTRLLTKKIRMHGALLGKIIVGENISFSDPNKENLVSKVSQRNVTYEGTGKRTIVQIDCGTKRNISNCLTKRNVRVITVPWDMNPLHLKEKFDAVLVSNGPGDPTMVPQTIKNVQELMNKKVPMLGICLGNQIIALAAGGKTKKLKFGHRGQNQPCILVGTKRCFLTTQNHGFVVSNVPNGFNQWFINANDRTNEGLIHKNLPIMSVQFHPEANPGPIDTEWIFDYFLKKINEKK